MAIGIQTPLPGLFNQFTQSRVALGTAGEGIIAHFLQQNGYEVSTNHTPADLCVFLESGHVVYVEVKTARFHFPRWQFSLYRRDMTDHRKAHIVILLCASKAGYGVPFVVPISACADVKQITISSCNPREYRGKFAPYRQSLQSLNLTDALVAEGIIPDWRAMNKGKDLVINVKDYPDFKPSSWVRPDDIDKEKYKRLGAWRRLGYDLIPGQEPALWALSWNDTFYVAYFHFSQVHKLPKTYTGRDDGLIEEI